MLKMNSLKWAVVALVVSTTFVFGQNNALNFDGTDDYVSSSFQGVTGTGARTIEAWIRTTANCNPSNGGVQNIIVDYGTFTTGTRFTFNVLWSNSIRLEIGGSGVSGTTPVNDGVWHHVAVTYNPSAGSNNIKLYIDGNLETQGTLTGLNTATGSNLQIGSRVDFARHFDGDIDEVRVWSKVLTASTLAAHANKEICQPDADLELYYQFNQGTAGGSNLNVTSVNDVFGNNNGILQNFTLTGASSNWITGNTAITNSSFSRRDTITGCNFAVLPTSGRTVNSSGEYIDSLTTQDGCDSLFIYQVNIETVDTAVNQNGAELISQALSPTTYQWLDCDNGFTAIAGETGPIFNASANGHYAVEVTNDNCVDTSACYEVTGIGLVQLEFGTYRVYPNPAHDRLNLELPSSISSGVVTIKDMNGKVCSRAMVSSSRSEHSIELSPGIYILHFESDSHWFTDKLIVE